MKEIFEKGFWSQEDVNDVMNNSLFYQIEKPANNMSGLFDHY
jgi:HNH/ENDO VII superfamily nuclease with conserved GHE residues